MQVEIAYIKTFCFLAKLHILHVGNKLEII